MRRREPMPWMMAQALESLQLADRLQRQFFRPGHGRIGLTWEPPVDVIDCGHEVTMVVALPGVAPDRFNVSVQDAAIVVMGERRVTPGIDAGEYLQLEIPYGRFERRISLPRGEFRIALARLEHGCLRLQLERIT